MSNEKLAEALRAFPEDPNPFTYRRCYAKAQEALQAHAAEAEQAQAQAAQPVGVPDGWVVSQFTGSWKRDDERWEVYDPTGSGGAINESDIKDQVVRGLLDALAAPQPPVPNADAEDAARYRWMRVHVFDDDNWGQGECNTPDEVDACIDAARAAEGDGNG